MNGETREYTSVRSADCGGTTLLPSINRTYTRHMHALEHSDLFLIRTHVFHHTIFPFERKNGMN